LRLPSLEADLQFLLGDGWQDAIRPIPATIAYCERIREVGASWPGGFVAHHYVRYLGDLSGGQMIAKVIKRACGLDEDGVRFYTFDKVTDPTTFKNNYRACLDRAPWSNEERQRIIAEALVAYDFNTRMLQDL
jgi:heme oxygenase